MAKRRVIIGVVVFMLGVLGGVGIAMWVGG
jgi:hypothetical protein